MNPCGCICRNSFSTEQEISTAVCRVLVRSQLPNWWSHASCIQHVSSALSWMHFYITAHFFSTGGALPSAFSISKMIRLKTSTAVCVARISSSEHIGVRNWLCGWVVTWIGSYHYLILLGWRLHESSSPGISKFFSLLLLDNPVEENKERETSLRLCSHYS